MANLRKQLIVDKELQHKIIRFLVLYSTIISLVFLCVLYSASNYFISKLAQLNIDQELVISLFNDVNYMAFAFFILIVIISLASSYFGLVFSNKIAGPIYNMNQTLDSNLKNNTQKLIKLRKDDYFVNLADKINILIEQKK